MKSDRIKVEIVDNTGGGEKKLRQMTKISRSLFEERELRTASPVYREWKSVLERERLTVSLLCDTAVAREISRRSRLIMQNSQPKQKQFLKDLSPEAVLPPDQEETTYELWKRKIGQMESKYIRLAEKAPSSLSRTELILTMNLREWRCFFQLDGHQPPHPRIRAVTRVMREKLRCQLPAVFDTGDRDLPL